jgi:hypothetical protein
MMTLEKKCAEAFETLMLQSSAVAAIAPILNPFKDTKVELPAIFIKPSTQEETLQNTGIYEIEVEIELRYIVERTTQAEALAIWQGAMAEIGEISGRGLDLRGLAIDLTAVNPSNFLAHYVEVGESEPTSRDGERHFTLTLQVGCATP